MAHNGKAWTKEEDKQLLISLLNEKSFTKMNFRDGASKNSYSKRYEKLKSLIPPHVINLIEKKIKILEERDYQEILRVIYF